MSKSTISIIIPVLNEAAIIQSTLEQLCSNAEVEVIVVDGGSKDNTLAIAKTFGIRAMVVSGGRAAQMNAGAKAAESDLLLFLHSDTNLPANFVWQIVRVLKQPEVIAGAFELGIDGGGIALRWIELLVKMRSHLFSLPYGDQAIFLTKQAFVDIGGFPQMPIMEDFELIQRLKTKGKIAIAPAKVVTSARRWQRLGVWKTTAINQLVIAGYYLGVAPDKLHRLYRNSKNSS